MGVDAPEEDAILEDRVEPEHRPVDCDRLRAAVDAEQAGDAAAAQQPEAVGHHLRVADGRDDEVEAAVSARRSASVASAVET